LRWPLAAGFFAAVSFAGILPSIGSSISFCPAVFFWLLRWFGPLLLADAQAQRVHQVDHVAGLLDALLARWPARCASC
jgi:hypothetical protein